MSERISIARSIPPPLAVNSSAQRVGPPPARNWVRLSDSTKPSYEPSIGHIYPSSVDNTTVIMFDSVIVC
jgi:hypothetical protein